jgi:hypothetical protein
VSEKENKKRVNILKLCCDWRHHKEPVGCTIFWVAKLHRTIIDELEGIWKQTPAAWSNYYPSTGLWEFKKTGRPQVRPSNVPRTFRILVYSYTNLSVTPSRLLNVFRILYNYRLAVTPRPSGPLRVSLNAWRTLVCWICGRFLQVGYVYLPN